MERVEHFPQKIAFCLALTSPATAKRHLVLERKKLATAKFDHLFFFLFVICKNLYFDFMSLFYTFSVR